MSHFLIRRQGFDPIYGVIGLFLWIGEATLFFGQRSINSLCISTDTLVPVDTKMGRMELQGCNGLVPMATGHRVPNMEVVCVQLNLASYWWIPL